MKRYTIAAATTGLISKETWNRAIEHERREELKRYAEAADEAFRKRDRHPRLAMFPFAFIFIADVRYAKDIANQVRRNPLMKPLLHNGGKPR